MTSSRPGLQLHWNVSDGGGRSEQVELAGHQKLLDKHKLISEEEGDEDMLWLKDAFAITTRAVGLWITGVTGIACADTIDGWSSLICAVCVESTRHGGAGINV